MSNTVNIAEDIKTTFDVREIPTLERHSLILGSFNQFVPGDDLLLINDHDPKPFYQFQAEPPGEYTWDHLKIGPDVRRVRIGRAQNTTPEVCGH